MELNDFSDFSRGSPKKPFCEIIFEIGPLAQEEMSFEEIVDGRTDIDQ